jgi:cell division protein FtsI (penicillin-binding protein 3)
LIASFVGFAPINNPALTILVQLDSPSMGSHMGGAVAAPVFKRVAEQALAYLNVPQDEAISPKSLHASHSSAVETATSDIADFDPVQVESPDTQEVNAEPAPAAPPAASASVAPPTVELAEGDGVQLPSLAGKTVRQVTEICQKLGVNPVLVGNGIAQQQQPEAGAMTRRGGSVTVWFGRPPEVAQARSQKAAK